MPNSGYKFVSQNCAELMRNAIQNFLESENRDRKRSRPITVFTRMKKILDPAWLEYSKIVDTSTPFDQLIRGFFPSEYAKEFGFSMLEDWCIHTVRTIGYIQDVSENKALEELIDTIAELRSFAIWCGRNKPKFKPVTKNNRSRNFNLQNAPLHCRVCNAATELRAFAAAPSMWVNDDFAVKRPSKIFCREHRPIPKNSGKLNPSYQKSLRHAEAIEKEQMRLHRQSFSWHESRAVTGDPFIDEFFRLIVDQSELYPDDEGILKKIASELIDAHITDIKKKIIVILRTGASQAQAAKYLQMSQQSISKAIAKVPEKFRFDLTCAQINC